MLALRTRAFLIPCLGLYLWAADARAAPPPAPNENGRSANGQVAGEANAQATEEVVANDSPRASMADFLALCRANEYAEAARYLDLPRALNKRGPVLARRLKAVLDRKAWLDPAKLSPSSTGNLDDDLPRFVDEVARFTGENGSPEPVLIARHNLYGGRWLFTSGTVAQIDGWYEQLADHWMLENLPRWLLRSGPRELLWWQWMALPLLALVSWVGGLGLSRLSSALLSYIAKSTPTQWDDELVKGVRRPLALWWALAIIYLLLPWLRMYEPAHEYVVGVLRGLFLVGFFWVLSRWIGVAAEQLRNSTWAERNRASRSLIPLIIRVAQIALGAIAAISVLSQLGYSVTSLIAGLGVGGLAVALAAQKTLENLFGAFAIGADQPFREGDFVRVDDFVATVESIGMRSTKFRTLDRTLITIPNGKLADMKVESFAARDRLRLACKLALAHDTTPGQVRSVLAGVEESLRAEPKLWPDGVTVRLLQVGSGSVDIEVAAWFATADWAEFQRIRQELLLSFMTVVERAGTSLALPTHRVMTQAI